MKRRGQGGSTTGNGQHERESLRFKRREIGRKRKALPLIVVVMRTRRRNALSTMALVWVCVCVCVTTMAPVKLWPWRSVVDQPWVLVMVVMETSDGSIMGFGYGGFPDR